MPAVISMRSFGYRMTQPVERRYFALNRAVEKHGFEKIMDRLEFLKMDNRKYADQTESDIWYLVNIHGPNPLPEIVRDVEKITNVINLMDNTVRTMKCGIELNDMSLIKENAEILVELFKMLNI